MRRPGILSPAAAALASVAVLAAALPPAAAYFGPGPAPHERTVPQVSLHYERGDRDMDVTLAAGGATASGEQDWSWNAVFARGLWPLGENTELHLDLGLADIDGGSISAGSAYSLDGDNGFLWGGGAGYALPIGSFGGDVTISLSGDVRGWSSGVVGGSLDAVSWEIGPRIASRFGDAKIYGGVSYTDMRIDVSGQTALGPLTGSADASDVFGLFLGGTYDFSPNLTAMIEGSAIGDRRLDVGLAYRFEPRPRPLPPSPQAAEARATTPAYTPPPAPPAPSYTPPPPQAPAPYEEPRIAKPPAYEVAPAPAPTYEAPEPPRTPVQAPYTPPPAPAAAPIVPTPQVQARDVRASEAAIERGNRAAALARYNEAVFHYRTAVQADPQNARARYNLATAYYLSGDYPSARASYEATIALSPLDADAFLYLGFTEYRLGNIEAARRAWRRVLELDPTSSVAANNLRVIGG